MGINKVISVTKKSINTFVIRVERPQLKIYAGQCFNVGIPGMGINREYSMYSSADADYLDFLIRIIDDGLVSSHLSKLSPGDMVEIDGPYGEFCLKQENLNSKLIFIGTGTGIAPFHSFVSTYPNLDYVLLHGVRHADEQYDSEFYERGKYISCISKCADGTSLRVTDYLSRLELPSNANIFICGNRNMIVDAVQILLDKGVNGDNIITEVFF